jgi:hypothetical protein
MDRAKKARKPLRTALTRTIHDAEADLEIYPLEIIILQERLQKIEDLEMKMMEWDVKVLDLMLDADANDVDYEAEHQAQEKYQDDVRGIKIRINKVLSAVVPLVMPSPSTVGSPSSKKMNFKLPTIEMKRFSGDMRELLGWWAQFEKINDDDELHPTDKFQYLVQVTVEDSRARRLVEGYPQTAANYPKVIEALKDRYGDKVLLTEIYVRQLARLVISNATNSRQNNLSYMFDELESSLRALEPLGVTADQSAAFLYPIVEASLPEDIVKVW